MPVNRELWELRIGKDRWPPGWHCPSCKGGYLELVKDGLRFDEAASSRGAHSEVWFEPDHVENRFSAMLQCTNESCKEAVTVIGKGSLNQVGNQNLTEDTWEEYFVPLHVFPTVQIIPLPESIPYKVSEQLKLAFSVLWVSPAAAATHVRIAIENLLDALRIPRSRRIKKVRMQRITLHERIGILRARAPSEADALLAIKWVGNAGSHLGELTRDDVFDSFDMLETVLDDLFVRNRATTQKLIRDINKRKGPRTKRAKSLI